MGERTIGAEHGPQQLAQMCGLLGVGLQQAAQELGGQAVPEDALREEADGADVDPGAESLREIHAGS